MEVAEKASAQYALGKLDNNEVGVDGCKELAVSTWPKLDSICLRWCVLK